MATPIEQTTWTARLAHVPDWALREELMRRGAEADTDQAVRLPGLTVDPIAGQVVWRGDGYELGGRPMEVVYALALAHQRGLRRVRSDALARAVLRGWDDEAARKNIDVIICHLGRLVPGLVVSERMRGGGFYAFRRLALDEAAPAGAERVA